MPNSKRLPHYDARHNARLHVKPTKRLNLLGIFLAWAKNILGISDHRVYPQTSGPPITGKYATAWYWQRRTPRACHTYKIVPKYPTEHPNSILFLYCDDIRPISGRAEPIPPRRNPLHTHRLTLVIIAPGLGGRTITQRYWGQDFEMAATYGEDNCTLNVTRLLAGLAVSNYHDMMDWPALASRAVFQLKK